MVQADPCGEVEVAMSLMPSSSRRDLACLFGRRCAQGKGDETAGSEMLGQRGRRVDVATRFDR
jgi:hypothetical protein